MSARILLVRSGGETVSGLPQDIDVVRTHEIASIPSGLSEALEAGAEGAWLLVSSATTVRMLCAAEPAFFARPFTGRLAAGAETAAAMLHAGAPEVKVPPLPGAAGMLDALPDAARRVLWPRGADADPSPIETLRAHGLDVKAPIVYEKRAVSALPIETLERIATGAYAGVAVSSLAALDVLLLALRRAGLSPSPRVRWGVVGPETASAFARYSLPSPVVPARPRLAELVEALRKVTS